MVPSLGQMNPSIASLTISSRSILILPSYICVGLRDSSIQISRPKHRFRLSYRSLSLSAMHNTVLDRPSHFPCSGRLNYIWIRIYIYHSTFLVMRFYSANCYFLPLRFHYSPQNSVFKHPRLIFST